MRSLSLALAVSLVAVSVSSPAPANAAPPCEESDPSSPACVETRAGRDANPAAAAPQRLRPQWIDVVGRVTAARTVRSQRRVGESRYIAVSDLFYRDRSAYLEVLDLVTMSVTQIAAKRSMLEKRFGAKRGGAATVPNGEIVLFRDGIVGLALTEINPGRSRRAWYAELEAETGALVRSIQIASLGDGETLDVIGADADGQAAWFAVTQRTPPDRTLVVRRVDLATLGTTEEQRVVLPPRAPAGAREHAVRVHASGDFTRFAAVEYAEDGVRMAPARVYLLDGNGGRACTVPAPPTTYGVAFAGDGRYVYLGSSQRGTISRIDVAGCRIDKQVPGPRYLHHLVVSRGGSKLYALSSSSSYTVYDLPDLRARHDAAHPAGLAAAMGQLYGDGVASLDGAFFVVPEAEDRRRASGPDRRYVIARLVD